MRTAWFDCVSGISGDMFVGALLDAGLDYGALRKELDTLALPGFTTAIGRVEKRGIAATAFTVTAAHRQPRRHLSDIIAIIEKSALSPGVKADAAAIFRRLADAEARVHGVAPEEVHFHEVGAVDSIVDIVAAAAGLRLMGIESICASPVPLGGGTAHCAHGTVPVPAPATAALLEGVPVCAGPAMEELTTPTGAALISHYAKSFGPMPEMTLRASGAGAGTKDMAHPNILRVFIGDSAGTPESGGDSLILYETNIDDMNPEFYDHVTDRLFAAGALDAYIVPVLMKKFRPGAVLTVLSRRSSSALIEEILFTETTTAGLRVSPVERRVLDRRVVTVETLYGRVRVKALFRDGRAVTLSPELDDCRKAADERRVPLKDVYAAARAEADKLLASGSLPSA